MDKLCEEHKELGDLISELKHRKELVWYYRIGTIIHCSMVILLITIIPLLSLLVTDKIYLAAYIVIALVILIGLSFILYCILQRRIIKMGGKELLDTIYNLDSIYDDCDAFISIYTPNRKDDIHMYIKSIVDGIEEASKVLNSK